MQKSILVIFLVDDEADRPRTGEQEDDRVDPGDVVGQKQKSAARQPLRADRGDAIDHPRERHSKETQGALGGGNWRHRFMIYNRRVAHCNRQFDERPETRKPNGRLHSRSPYSSRSIFLITSIARFSRRSSRIRATFFSRQRIRMRWRSVERSAAHFLSPTCSARRILGWLSDRFSRWFIVGCAVILWSLASGGHRGSRSLSACFLHAHSGRNRRGRLRPGRAHHSGRPLSARDARTNSGALLRGHSGGQRAWLCFRRSSPDQLPFCSGGGTMALRILLRSDSGSSSRGLLSLSTRPARRILGFARNDSGPSARITAALVRTRSYVLNCAAQTAMTFALGGIGFWVAAYLKFRGQPASATQIFGVIIAGTGLVSTLAGGWLGDRLRARISGSYFLVSGCGMLLACPFFIAMLFIPFPRAWWLMARLGFLFVPEYRPVEHRPGECCSTEGSRDRLCAQHSCDSRAWRRFGLSHHRLHVPDIRIGRSRFSLSRE